MSGKVKCHKDRTCYRTHAHTRPHTQTPARTHARAHTHTHTACPHTRACACTHTYKHACPHTQARACTHIHTPTCTGCDLASCCALYFIPSHAIRTPGILFKCRNWTISCSYSWKHQPLGPVKDFQVEFTFIRFCFHCLHLHSLLLQQWTFLLQCNNSVSWHSQSVSV